MYIGVMHDGLSEFSTLSLQLQNRSISLWNANTCIERTIRVLNSMANQPGPRSEEASHACASNTASSGNTFKNKYEDLLKDMEVLEPKSWLDNCDIQFGDKNIRRLTAIFQVDERSTIQGFREYKDTRVISSISPLNPLLVAIKTIAISSSECERTFSAMNNTVTFKRNKLTTQHISSLLFIQCVGPPVIAFNPANYVK
ncbi:uncharacterized protein LOC126555582 isoform X3 [Aphis gossypii]|uniref:uncharacterized protein LOC126555582 isoform X3 n=1 Tax=Aphis gossypii TaxID=80765 RepID=UPI002158F43C|nr:uncharacterized protein LOC126555582 isoform X3 [Aphis gossypii]